MVVANHESRVCIPNIYIVLYQIAYVIAYSTLLHHLVLCVDHKMAMIETGLYYKKIKHVFAGHQNYSERDIMFLSTFIYLPVFVFVLINKSMFVCHIIQVFLRFSGQTNIRYTGYSVHNHLCIIIFFTQQSHNWN